MTTVELAKDFTDLLKQNDHEGPPKNTMPTPL